MIRAHTPGCGRCAGLASLVTPSLMHFEKSRIPRGTSIVNLGLIYDISISEDGFVIVEMTTTTRFCPASGFLTEAAKIRLGALEQVSKAQVRLVYNPPWSPDMAELFSF
ncbi:metal-sulfur cluster assembly factor [Rhizobium sp. 3T7]|uniref:metal-sulfur cluster assembly factor n=1 Tax=Rhizobium sp. 3T7 TaxID=2874922 RepID=UPI00398CDFFF